MKGFLERRAFAVSINGQDGILPLRGARVCLKTALLVTSAMVASSAMAQQQPTDSAAATTSAPQTTTDSTPPANAGAQTTTATTAANAGAQTTTATTATNGAQPASDDKSMNDIIVTGNTSGKRTLFDSSSDVTLANAADIQRKAPRSTAEALEMVPGIFVEATAGAVSNNYSVRGLAGGGQTFIQLEEDGMPIRYAGNGGDEYFQNDITIDRMEAVEGGTSGILAVNGAAATINFISQKPDFDKATAMVRATGTSYGQFRTDAYFSAPIADNLAFSIGGDVISDPGYRRSSFNYNTYHIKAMLEKRFDDGGFIRFTLKRGDESDAYYADMPFTANAAGQIGNAAGLNGHTDNIGGAAFANINIPVSCATGTCNGPFSLSTGIHTTTTQYRIDVEKPVSDKVSVFARARYMDSNFDFNGIFPGSNGQPPASAVDYLTPGVSPITSLLQSGPNSTNAFGASTFGIRNTTTGQIISANDPTALNALNGNGLLEETVLNHQTIRTKEFGSDFGVKINTTSGIFDNSLTIGGMYYNVNTASNQSAVATVINGVSNNSSIYDIVALNSQNQVLGQLTNNGMISYGDWGQGLYQDQLESYSAYFNDELKIGDNLHIDGGLRWEHEHDDVQIGNPYPTGTAPTVPAGTPGIITSLGSQVFNGTFTPNVASYSDLAGTIGVNYTLTRNVAVYARYSKGFQTYGGDSGGNHAPANLTLYEVGVRYQSHSLSGSLVAFRTQFRNQSYSFTDPGNTAFQTNATADDNIQGIQLDADWKPVHFFDLSVSGVYQDPKLQNLRFNGTPQPQYTGNTPAQSPKELLTVTPAFILPHGLGEIYGRYKYIGKIYADAGDGVALPAYGVFTIGASVNLTRRINLNVSVDNLTNAYGWTEGNPRQGQTQSVVDGIFYGRSIVGRNALASVTIKL